jgi:putative transposase
MHKRIIVDDRLYAHFVTFSCYRRRKLLDHEAPRQIVVEALAEQLQRLDGRSLGYVVMPEHVHAILWFPSIGRIGELMKQWKRTSSYRIARQSRAIPNYVDSLQPGDPVWQPRYYDFNICSESKWKEKLDYIHNNPVRAGLVARPEDWPASSAGHHLAGRSTDVPIGFVDAGST